MKINLLDLKPWHFRDTIVLPETIISWFQNQDAFWQYQGSPDPKNPHAELTSGLCSDGFIDCLRILCYPNVAEILGFQLAQKMQPYLIRVGKVDWVVSSAYAAITFGHEVAKAVGAKFMFTEKDPSDPKGKKMLWQRITIPEGSVVLQVEELITTSGTFHEVRRAIQEGNSEAVNFVPVIGALVHRPETLSVKYGDLKVVALIEREIKNWNPADCPLCRVGSPRLRPKKNWAQLTRNK